MADMLVGIAPRALIMKAETWEDDEVAVEYLEIEVNEASDMMLGQFKPKTNIEFYDENGSIGRYTMMFRARGLYIFGRGEIDSLFK